MILSNGSKPFPQPDPTPPGPDELGEFAARLIRWKARQLCARAEFSSSDREDIEQDLSLKLLKQRRKFDPNERPWPVFAKTVVERRAASLVRDQRAGKRGSGKTLSLHTPVTLSDQEVVEWIRLIGDGAHRVRLGQGNLAEQKRAELAADVAQAIAGLPKKLQPIARGLMHGTVAAIAKELKLPRSTVVRRVQSIRQHFERLQLTKYC